MKKYYHGTCRILPCLALIITQMALASAQAAGTADNPGQFSSSDYKFAKDAAMGGMMEVNLGNLAAQNSPTPSVQQFGQRMVKDHGQAGQELQQIASNKGATLPMQLPPKDQKEVDRLAKLSGAEFDKAYVSCMVKMHKADEKKFKKASENVQDADLKGFATRTLPIVQDHLRVAESLEQSLQHSLSMNR